MTTLIEAFQAFAGQGQEMDGRTWVKCLKDSMLLDEDFTSVDADLIFARVKGRGARRIDFATFRKALGEVAKKWNSMTQEQVEDIVCLASAPHYDNQADMPLDDTQGPARFYYDMSLYTGTHKYGGPTMVGNGICEGSPVDFQEHVNRDREGEMAASAERRRKALMTESGEDMPRLLGKPRSPGSPGSPGAGRRDSKVRRPVSSLKGPERFFYDKSSYTGTHKHGSPSVTGNGLPKKGYEDLSELVRRDHVQDDELGRRRRAAGEETSPVSLASPVQEHRVHFATRPQDLPVLLGAPRSPGEVKVGSPNMRRDWQMPASPPVTHKVMRAESSGYQVSSPWMSPMPVLSPQAPQVQHGIPTAPQRTVHSPAWYTQPFTQVAPMMMPVTTGLR